MVMYACVCVLKSHRRKIQSNLPCLAPVNTLLCLWNPPSFFHPVPSLLPLCSQLELSSLSSLGFLCVTPPSTPVTYAVMHSGRASAKKKKRSPPLFLLLKTAHVSLRAAVITLQTEAKHHINEPSLSGYASKLLSCMSVL